MSYIITADYLFKNGTLINRLQACFNYLTLCDVRHVTLEKGSRRLELVIYINENDDIDELQKICDENLGSGFNKNIEEYTECETPIVTLSYSALLDTNI